MPLFRSPLGMYLSRLGEDDEEELAREIEEARDPLEGAPSRSPFDYLSPRNEFVGTTAGEGLRDAGADIRESALDSVTPDEDHSGEAALNYMRELQPDRALQRVRETGEAVTDFASKFKDLTARDIPLAVLKGVARTGESGATAGALLEEGAAGAIGVDEGAIQRRTTRTRESFESLFSDDPRERAKAIGTISTGQVSFPRLFAEPFAAAIPKIEGMMSERFREASKKQWVKDGEGNWFSEERRGEALSDPLSYLSLLSESVPYTLPGMIAAARVGSAAYGSALARGSSKGLTGTELRKFAEREAMGSAMLAGGATEGTLVATLVATEIEDEIVEMDEAELMQNSELYGQMRAAGMSHEEAARAVARSPAMSSAVLAGVGTGVLGGPVNAYIGRLFGAGRAGGSRLMSALKVGAAETPVEGTQEAWEQVQQNLAVGKFDPSIMWYRGVPNAAVAGAAAGGTMGAGIGAAAPPSADTPFTLARTAFEDARTARVKAEREAVDTEAFTTEDEKWNQEEKERRRENLRKAAQAEWRAFHAMQSEQVAELEPAMQDAFNILGERPEEATPEEIAAFDEIVERWTAATDLMQIADRAMLDLEKPMQPPGLYEFTTPEGEVEITTGPSSIETGDRSPEAQMAILDAIREGRDLPANDLQWAVENRLAGTGPAGPRLLPRGRRLQRQIQAAQPEPGTEEAPEATEAPEAAQEAQPDLSRLPVEELSRLTTLGGELADLMAQSRDPAVTDQGAVFERLQAVQAEIDAILADAQQEGPAQPREALGRQYEQSAQRVAVERRQQQDRRAKERETTDRRQQQEATVVDDDPSEYPGSKSAFFDESGDAHIRFIDAPDGKVHIVGINAEGTGVRGHSMVEWLATQYPDREIVADEVALNAEGFWDSMKDRGLVSEWSNEPYTPDDDIMLSRADDQEIQAQLEAGLITQEEADERRARMQEPDAWEIVDRQTGEVVGTTSGRYAKQRARNRVDKLDLEYGAVRYLARPRRTEEPGEPMLSRRPETRESYEQRIDDLASGTSAPKVPGVRVLDDADIVSFLGHPSKPLVLQEGKLVESLAKHNMSPELWKRIPEMLDDPVAVFEDTPNRRVPGETQEQAEMRRGRLIIVPGETVTVQGESGPEERTLNIIIDPRPHSQRGHNVSLVVTGYDAHVNRPYEGWLDIPLDERDGPKMLRYIDKRRAGLLGESFRPQLARLLASESGRGTSIKTHKALLKWRKEKGLESGAYYGGQPMLSRRQDQTETPEFKAWFDQSVVTTTGNPGDPPLEVYHGGQKLDAWAREHKRLTGEEMPFAYGAHAAAVKGTFKNMNVPLSQLEIEHLDEPVFFFTDDEGVAAGYGDQGNHYEVRTEYLKMQRPADLRGDDSDEIASVLLGDENAAEMGWRELSHALRWNWVEVRRRAVAAGYDGIIFMDTDVANRGKHTAYAVFEPTQIKSATDNSGAFDPTNPSILRHAADWYAERALAQVSSEARPSPRTGKLPGIHTAPLDQQARYMDAIMDALTEDGVNIIARELGLKQSARLRGVAAWELVIGEGLQERFEAMLEDNGDGTKSVPAELRRSLSALAAATGLVLSQDSVAWHVRYPVDRPELENGVEIKLGRPINHAEAEALYSVMYRKVMALTGRQDAAFNFAPIPTEQGFRVLNFPEHTEVPNLTFHGLLQEAVEEVYSDSPLDIEVVGERFATDGALIGTDWRKNDGGQDYWVEIANSGRLGFGEWLGRVVYPRIARVDRQFADQYEWGSPHGRLAGWLPAAVEQRSRRRKIPASQARSPALKDRARFVPRSRHLAQQYLEQNGLTQPRAINEYVEVDTTRGAEIARAFDRMEHAPNDPRVQAAYAAMAAETKAQFEFLQANVVRFEVWKNEGQPYANSQEMLDDIRENNHLWFFPTEAGFGDPESQEMEDHPLLQKSGVILDGQELVYNDLFRAVHDYFGHSLGGFHFGPRGEENAWRVHSQMYSPEARGAVTTETRGQNSWVNFGPNGETNRANPAQTVYSEQKVGLLPEKYWTFEGTDAAPEIGPAFETNAGQGISRTAALSIAMNMANTLGVSVPVVVVNSPESAPNYIYNYLKRIDGVGNTIGAFVPDYAGPYIMLFANNARTEKEATAAVFHEAVGHFGLRSALSPEEYGNQMDAIIEAFPMEVRRSAKRNGITNETKTWDKLTLTEKRYAAEETFAYSTEQWVNDEGAFTPKKRSVLQRVWDAIRQFLFDRNWGRFFNMEYGSDDMLALTRRSYDFVRSGNYRQVNSMSPVARMVRGEVFYSQMAKVLDDILPDVGSVEQVLGQIRKAKGFKSEELKWSGLEGFLERFNANDPSNDFMSVNDLVRELNDGLSVLTDEQRRVYDEPQPSPSPQTAKYEVRYRSPNSDGHIVITYKDQDGLEELRERIARWTTELGLDAEIISVSEVPFGEQAVSDWEARNRKALKKVTKAAIMRYLEMNSMDLEVTDAAHEGEVSEDFVTEIIDQNLSGYDIESYIERGDVEVVPADESYVSETADDMIYEDAEHFIDAATSDELDGVADIWWVDKNSLVSLVDTLTDALDELDSATERGDETDIAEWTAARDIAREALREELKEQAERQVRIENDEIGMRRIDMRVNIDGYDGSFPDFDVELYFEPEEAGGGVWAEINGGPRLQYKNLSEAQSYIVEAAFDFYREMVEEAEQSEREGEYQWTEYTVSGARDANYRETVYQLRGRGAGDYTSYAHYDDEHRFGHYLSHGRFSDRTTTGDSTVTYIEENQSDRMQDAREQIQGFAKKVTNDPNIRKTIERALLSGDIEGAKKIVASIVESARATVSAYNQEIEDIKDELTERVESNPDAMEYIRQLSEFISKHEDAFQGFLMGTWRAERMVGYTDRHSDTDYINAVFKRLAVDRANRTDWVNENYDEVRAASDAFEALVNQAVKIGSSAGELIPQINKFMSFPEIVRRPAVFVSALVNDLLSKQIVDDAHPLFRVMFPPYENTDQWRSIVDRKSEMNALEVFSRSNVSFEGTIEDLGVLQPMQKTWPLIVVKDAIRQAAESGASHVAWADGTVHAVRWHGGEWVRSFMIKRLRDFYGEERYEITHEDTPMTPIGGIGVSEFGKYLDQFAAARLKKMVANLIPMTKDDAIEREAAGNPRVDGPSTLNVQASDLLPHGITDNLYKGDSKYRWSNAGPFAASNISVDVVDRASGKVYLSNHRTDRGTGLRGFYDDMLPKMVNKFLKPYGVSVELVPVKIVTNEGAHYWVNQMGFRVTDEMKDAALQGMPMWSRRIDDDNSTKQNNRVEQEIPAPALQATNPISATFGSADAFSGYQAEQGVKDVNATIGKDGALGVAINYLNEMRYGDLVPDAPRDLGWFRNAIEFPRNIAMLFPEFTPVWEAGEERFEIRDAITSELFQHFEAYKRMPREKKEKVDMLLQIGRLTGEDYVERILSGRLEHEDFVLRIRNTFDPIFSESGNEWKFGEFMEFDMAEQNAYVSLRNLFNRQLGLLRQVILTEMGYGKKGDPWTSAELQARMEKKTGEGAHPSELAALAIAIEKIQDIETAERSGYVPFTRFGDYAITVIGPSGETAHSEWFETDKYVGKAIERRTTSKVEINRARKRLKEKYSPNKGYHHYEYDTAKRKMVNNRDITMADFDAIAQLGRIEDELWDRVRDHLETGLKTTGWRSHLIGSQNIPGYSLDFERSIANSVIGFANYIANRSTRDKMTTAINTISDTQPKLKKYAMDWDNYISSPSEEWQKYRMLMFILYLADNVSSWIVNSTQVPVVTFSYLTQFASDRAVAKELARAYKDVEMMLSMKEDEILPAYDPDKAPEDVRDDLKKAWARGLFVPRVALEQMGLSAGRNPIARRLNEKYMKVGENLTAMYSSVERMNRLVTFIAVHRLATKRKDFLSNMDRILRDQANALWISKVDPMGTPTPEMVSEWVIDETHFRQGKLNRPRLTRDGGAAIFQFMNFYMNAIMLHARLAVASDEGRKAVAMFFLMLWMFSGISGLPGVTVGTKIYEGIFKLLKGYDIDLSAEYRKFMVDLAQMAGEKFGDEALGADIGRYAAEVMWRGPISTLSGMDFSTRVGMGRIGQLESAVDNKLVGVLGIPGDFFINKPINFVSYLHQQRYAAAATQYMTPGSRNLLQQYLWGQEGVRSMRGDVVVPAEKVTAGMRIRKAIGFNPTELTIIRDREWSSRRAENARRDMQTRYYRRAANAIVREDFKELDAILMEIDSFNADKPDYLKVQLNHSYLNRLVQQMHGGYGDPSRRSPRSARSERERIYGSYPPTIMDEEEQPAEEEAAEEENIEGGEPLSMNRDEAVEMLREQGNIQTASLLASMPTRLNRRTLDAFRAAVEQGRRAS